MTWKDFGHKSTYSDEQMIEKTKQKKEEKYILEIDVIHFYRFFVFWNKSLQLSKLFLQETEKLLNKFDDSVDSS